MTFTPGPRVPAYHPVPHGNSSASKIWPWPWNISRGPGRFEAPVSSALIFIPAMDRSTSWEESPLFQLLNFFFNFLCPFFIELLFIRG
jgi:hypothetical protein